MAVVENQYLHRQFCLPYGAELLYVHLERTVADDGDDFARRVGHLGAHRGRQGKPHRAEAAGGDVAVGSAELVVARRYHLVLAHIGDDDRLTFRLLTQHTDGFRHRYLPAFRVQFGVSDNLLLLRVERFELCYPLTVVAALHERGDGRKEFLRISVNGDLGLDDLVELRRIDVHMNDLGMRKVPRHLARHAVVEAHAYREHYVGLIGELVGRVIAVHAEHAHVERVVRRHRGKPQERRSGGYAAFLRKLPEFLLRFRDGDTVPEKHV